LPGLTKAEQLHQVIAEGLPDTFPPLRTEAGSSGDH
jgi:hypothetical protein